MEQKIKLKNYIKEDSDTISIPMRVYLKAIAYKEQIPLFMQQIHLICKQGGYEYKDIKARFSNSFLDDLMFSGFAPHLSMLQNNSVFKSNNTNTQSEVSMDKVADSKMPKKLN